MIKRFLLSCFVLLLFSVSAGAYIDDDFIIPIEEKPNAIKPAASAPSTSPQKGATWTDPTTGMKFVWVPGGCFQMGSNDGDEDETPVHEVCVDGFWMGRYEVTNAQYRCYKPDHNSNDINIEGYRDLFPKFKDHYEQRTLNGNTQPVVRVSWQDVTAYADWLSSTSNGRFRLPTEAEWEYAARSGGKNDEYVNANNIDRVAWHHFNSSYDKTHPVGGKEPNAFGLYDTAGNVEEWCQDEYFPYGYPEALRKNRVMGEYPLIAIRGGSVKSQHVNDVLPTARGSHIGGSTSLARGFRLVKTD